MTSKTRMHLVSVATGSAVLWSLGSAFTFFQNPHSRQTTSPAFTRFSVETQCQIPLNQPLRPSLILFESESGFVEADDMDAIQALFNKYCDGDGLMTKSALVSVPPFSDMLVSSSDKGSLACVGMLLYDAI
jgi:hypothetical protein